ncbi:hypothetical protein SELMODRAFT_405826 [Selaginella moellendorffii]|uniref:Terpene synthase n=1 Tax=Selaginella moellendorffii TaxID=88036 RepID=D8QZT8_SELML|nr:(E)-2-epi-beta-caryophyllene synthase-like [Selaginella moellendorffii]EFJ34466.1 hypothetical protein SELMODRAFT_405826 [Selaginella moellendorffii]|eukprot:XP_002964133.1 (E)-2-epi-beta-caryophyllene synthase-like [Selaginella moellendorffii]
MAAPSIYRPQILEQLLACKSIYLPQIRCSLPLQCHPDYASVSKQANDWAFRFLKINATNAAADKKYFTQWRMPLYGTFVVPWGDSRHALAAAKYTWLITILDDAVDEEPSQRDEILEAYMSLASGQRSIAQVPNKPVLVAQAELIPDLQKLMSPLLFQRLLVSYRKFVGCYSAKVDEEEFTKESYAVHRREDYVVKPMLNFTQMCLGVELRDKDLESEEYLRAIDAMFDHMWLVNDIFSFPKELRKKTFKNIIFLLLFTDHTVRSVQQAVDKANAMIQEKEQEFMYYHEILTRKAMESGNHDFLAYLRAIPAFIPGNLRWHYLAARYHGVDNPFVTGEPSSGTWLFHDTQTIILPEYKPTHPHLQV